MSEAQRFRVCVRNYKGDCNVVRGSALSWEAAMSWMAKVKRWRAMVGNIGDVWVEMA